MFCMEWPSAAEERAIAAVAEDVTASAELNRLLHARVSELEDVQQGAAAAAIARAEAHESEAKRLTDALAEATTRLRALEANHETASELSMTMAGRVHELKTAMDAIKADAAEAARAAMSAVNGKVEAMELTTARVETEMTRLREFDDKVERASALSARVAEVESELVIQKRRAMEVADMEGRVRELQTRAEDAARARNGLKEAIETLETDQKERFERIIDVQTSVVQNQAAAGAVITAGMEQLVRRVSELDEKKATSADVDTLNERVCDLEKVVLYKSPDEEKEDEAREKETATIAAAVAATSDAAAKDQLQGRLDELERKERKSSMRSVVGRWQKGGSGAVSLLKDTKAANAAAEAAAEAAEKARASIEALASRVAEVEKKQDHFEDEKAAAAFRAATSESDADTAASNAEQAAAAAVHAAASAAGATESLASELAKLRNQILALEGQRGPEARDASRGARTPAGSHPAALPPTPTTVDIERIANESEYHVSSPQSPPVRGGGRAPVGVGRTNFSGVTSEEAAAAAAELVIADELDDIEGRSDPIANARRAAMEARRAVNDEAAKLGIHLDEDTGKLADGEGLPMHPAALAAAADRQLAAELATVCALVDKEESRRAELKAKATGPQGVQSVLEATLRPSSKKSAGEKAVADLQAAQKRWEIAMDVQLSRLREAAHEAEERNAVAAAMSGRAVAKNTTELFKRAGAVLSKHDARKGGESALHNPWGAGPGLKPKAHVPTPTPRRPLSNRDRNEPARGISVETAAELKSIKSMVRTVHVEIGGLAHRLDKVDERATGAGKAEADVMKARLEELRGDVKSLRKAADVADRALSLASDAEAGAAAAYAHAQEVGASLSAQRSDHARLRERVDALAHGADAGIRAVDGKVERVKAAARGAKATARMAEARCVSLAGELGRVARHVGMDGVGEALRTGVLFAPPPQPPPPPGLPPTYQPPPPSARARRGGRPGDAADDDDENLFEIPVAGDANGGMSLEQLAEL